MSIALTRCYAPVSLLSHTYIELSLHSVPVNMTVPILAEFPFHHGVWLRPLTNVSGLYSVVGLTVSVVHACILPSVDTLSEICQQ